MVDYRPEGYSDVSAYLIVDGAAAALDFYTTVFGATVRVRMDAPGGKVGHAEFDIGDSLLMLADEDADMDARGPRAVGGSPVMLCLYVQDVDAVVERAVANGATLLRPVEDKFYGDRAGVIEDPFGHRWNVATHVEDVTPEEMGRRLAALMPEGQSGE
jgi:PhnB protein